jgi:hypothetical protein
MYLGCAYTGVKNVYPFASTPGVNSDSEYTLATDPTTKACGIRTPDTTGNGYTWYVRTYLFANSCEPLGWRWEGKGVGAWSGAHPPASIPSETCNCLSYTQ